MADTAMNHDYFDARFEKVWAILQEVAEGQKETRLQMQETDRLMKENAERQKQEIDQLMKENIERQKETDRIIQETARQMKITDKKFGELSNRFGELAEHLVIPNIKEKFNALGFTFVQASENIRITDLEDNCLAEIDILLENGSIVMVLEVKSKPAYKDVDAHIKRMEVIRRAADKRNDKRVFQGAIAGAIMSKEVRGHILKNGFYAIEQTGDTVKINIPEGFKARQW